MRNQLIRGFNSACDARISEATNAEIYLANHPQLDPAQFAETYHYKAAEQRVAGFEQVAAETAANATLYWATAGQTRLAAGAARSLPDWSAGQAIPSQQGLMLFEEPIATINREHDDPQSPMVSVDAIMWTNHTGPLILHWLSRSPRHLGPERKVHYGNHTVWPVNYLWCHINTVGAELDPRSPDAGGLTNLLGALWLLIGQDRVSTTEEFTTNTRRSQSERATQAVDDGDYETVIIIDLHKAQPRPRQVGDDQRAQPIYRHQWWVDGHWRQQACGPNRAERRPTFIAPHVKGPTGKPFIAEPERVYVLRDHPDR